MPISLPPPVAFDLACVGSSLTGYFNITLDAVRHIQAARTVFLYALNDDHLEFLRALNGNVVDLNRSHYIDGLACPDVYADIIDYVLDEARRGGVAYVHQGSPTFQTYTGVELVRRARREGLTACVLPGVSSLECLLCELGLTDQLDDLQIYTCRGVASGRSKIDPYNPCMLFNISVFAAEVVNQHVNLAKPDKLEALMEVLVERYGMAHGVWRFHIRPEGGLDRDLLRVDGLDNVLHSGPSGLTLYLPALQR